VGVVLTLARKEAIASGIFFGSSGWSGNVTLLALLGYGPHAFFLLQLRVVAKCSAGGTLVSKGAISVGDLTSLLLYTVYVGTGLQMLTLVYPLHPMTRTKDDYSALSLCVFPIIHCQATKLRCAETNSPRSCAASELELEYLISSTGDPSSLLTQALTCQALDEDQ
jgi:hypothetical protein